MGSPHSYARRELLEASCRKRMKEARVVEDSHFLTLTAQVLTVITAEPLILINRLIEGRGQLIYSVLVGGC